MNQDPRIDQYILKAAPFAAEIMEHLRDLVHRICPEAEETMKWSFPHFMYRDSILCSMAAFKEHCAFGFWLGPVMEDPYNLFVKDGNEKAMGQWGRIRSLSDLPEDRVMAEYILQAVQLTDAGVKLSKTPASAKPKPVISREFRAALDNSPAAAEFFKALSDSAKREYTEWIGEAKTETTRQSRMETALVWLSEGKTRNWKYKK